MEKLKFERRKYGKELLIDACNEEELDIVADTLVPNFYTIIFVRAGSGAMNLDTEHISLQGHTVVFVRPGQVCQLGEAQFGECHLLFFEGDFLDEFFSDKDFIFKFGFFHNPEQPSFIRLSPADFAKNLEVSAYFASSPAS